MAGEISVSPEPRELAPSSRMYGLQGRMELYNPSHKGTENDSLNINNKKLAVTKEGLGKNEAAFQKVLAHASTQERDTYWKEKGGTYAEQMNAWKNNLVAGVESRKTYFAKPEQGAFFKQLGIDTTTSFDTTQADAIYNKYFSADKTTSQTDVFAQAILTQIQRPNGTYDSEKLTQHTEGIRFMASIFGKNGAEVIMQKLNSTIELKNNPDAFVAHTKEAVNTIVPSSKEETLVLYLQDAEATYKEEAKPVAPVPTVPVDAPAIPDKKPTPAPIPGEPLKTTPGKTPITPPSPDDTPISSPKVDTDDAAPKIITVEPTAEPYDLTKKTKEVQNAHQEIFELAGKRTKTEMIKLINSVHDVQIEMMKQGNGKLAETIAETEKKGYKEIVCDGVVTYIPKGAGELVVIGDLHGDFEAMKHIVEKKQFIENMESGDKSMILVVEGDYLDRGKKQVELMESLLEMKRRYPNNVVLMKADHEVVDGVSSHDYPKKALSHYDKGVYTGDMKPILEMAKRTKYTHDVFTELEKKGLVTQDQIDTFMTKVFTNQDNYLNDYKKKRDEFTVAFSPEDKKEFDDAVGYVYNEYVAPHSPLFKDELFNKALALLPRMVVCGNGVVMTHGGPTYEGYNLQQLARLRGNDIDQTFDHITTWADAVPDVDSLIKADAHIFADVDEAIKRAELTTDNRTKLEGTVWHLSSLKIAKKRLELARKNGFWFNSGRMDTGKLSDALWGNNVVYSEKGLEQFLGQIGGTVMVRGHEKDQGNPFSKNILYTIHSTGKGSPDSYYSGQVANPCFATFDKNKTIASIDASQNIAPVWKN